MLDAWTKRDLHRWLRTERSRQPRLRTDEVSDGEVLRAIRECPAHYTGIALAQAIPAIASTNSGTSLASAAFSANPTVGNYITYWSWGWASNTSADVATVADSTGANTYTKYGQHLANDLWISCGWAKVGTSGATFKVTVTAPAPGTGSSINVLIAEWSGVISASPVDGTPTGTTGTSVTVAPGSMTVQTGSLVIGVSSDDNTTYGGSTPTGFTRAGFQNNGSANQVGEGIYAIGAGSPSNPSRTVTSAKWTAQQFALLATSAKAPPPYHRSQRFMRRASGLLLAMGA